MGQNSPWKLFNVTSENHIRIKLHIVSVLNTNAQTKPTLKYLKLHVCKKVIGRLLDVLRPSPFLWVHLAFRNNALPINMRGTFPRFSLDLSRFYQTTYSNVKCDAHLGSSLWWWWCVWGGVYTSTSSTEGGVWRSWCRTPKSSKFNSFHLNSRWIL